MSCSNLFLPTVDLPLPHVHVVFGWFMDKYTWHGAQVVHRPDAQGELVGS